MDQLKPYQYRLQNVTFGRNTDIPISKVEVQPHNVQVQDAQSPRSDEIRFGVDTLAPGAIGFMMGVMENFPLDSMEGLTSEHLSDELLTGMSTKLPLLAATWKSRELRMTWGKAIPLLTCDRYGVVRRIYGRPGKLAHSPRVNDNTMWIDVQAEFRRMDTYSHNDDEYFVGPVLPNGFTEIAERADGDADAWFRLLVVGPAMHPVIQYGGETIELNMKVNAGQTVEISSYPWSRRVVDQNGVNHRRKIIGSTKYLDQLIFKVNDEIPISWTATETTTDTRVFFLWREAYNVF